MVTPETRSELQRTSATVDYRDQVKVRTTSTTVDHSRMNKLQVTAIWSTLNEKRRGDSRKVDDIQVDNDRYCTG